MSRSIESHEGAGALGDGKSELDIGNTKPGESRPMTIPQKQDALDAALPFVWTSVQQDSCGEHRHAQPSENDGS